VPTAPNPEPAEPDTWTVGRVLRWTQQRFTARGIASPRLDAELLLAFALKRSRVALYTGFDQQLEKDELASFRALIQRRLGGAPVAYLVGVKEFYGVPFQVSEAVLIPRPETELLVEVALELLPPPASQPAAPPPSEPAPIEPQPAEPGVELHIAYDSIDEPAATPAAAAAAPPLPTALPPPPLFTLVDVGTGSGAVALTLARSRRDVRVLAIDSSEAALVVAATNAAQQGLGSDPRLTLLHGDLLLALPAGTRLDLIVANLPYIPSAEIPQLAAEVRSEPLAALDGGPDGLVLVRRLIGQAPKVLRPGGAIALEIGAGQAAAVEALLRDAGFHAVRSQLDLAQIPRVVSGRLPS
jgi:release factor glutamine methyltransferase